MLKSDCQLLTPAKVEDAFTELLSIKPTENEYVHFADYVLADTIILWGKGV